MVKIIDDLPDSGERQHFNTGSVRDIRKGKGRYDLISPFALKRLAKHYENGSVKYGDRNWEKGQPIMRYLDSAIRHLQEYQIALLSGVEPTEDNLAATAWNVFAMMDHEERLLLGLLPEEIDDRPKLHYKKSTTVAYALK